MQKPLILSSTPVEDGMSFGLRPGLPGPRRDYEEIGRLLGAKIMGPDLYDGLWYRSFREIERLIRLNLVESFVASRQSPNYSQLLSTSEKVAIPVAMLLGAKRAAAQHIVIAHRLSSPFKSALFRAWPLHKSFTHVICVCRSQAEYAVQSLGIEAAKVDFVYDKVDQHFFQPVLTDSADYVLCVGQEQRDYDTLLKAIANTDIKTIVVASSRWSNRQIHLRLNGARNVKVLANITYEMLRRLYASARMVVAPLFDVRYAAGVNTVLESMAMAKPTVVSRTAGISDYVLDNTTGVFVSPGDTGQLRDTLLSLWDQPREQKRLGENARQLVEEQMNLDNYVRKIVAIMSKASSKGEG